MEGKARAPAPHTVPGPKSPLCPKIETHHILECVLPGEGRQRIPEALVCTVCKAMLAPLGKTHRRRRSICSSREAGTVQPRSDAEAVALGTSRLGVVGLLPEAFKEADPIFKEPGRAGYRPEGLPLYAQTFKAAWIYCGS